MSSPPLSSSTPPSTPSTTINDKTFHLPICKKHITSKFNMIYFRDEQIDFWYNMALKFFKQVPVPQSTTYEHVIFSSCYFTRDEAVLLGALQCYIMNGPFDEEKHIPGFMDERNKQFYLHPMHRRDPTIEEDILKEFSKLYPKATPTSTATRNEAKRRFIDLCRLYKRLQENVFKIHIYSADKIDARLAVLIVGEDVIIFDYYDQSIIHNFPVESATLISNQHTSKNERDRLRKQLGHVSHLHQLVIEVNKSLVLRILSPDRAVIRKRFDSSIELALHSLREKMILERSSSRESLLVVAEEMKESYVSVEQVIAWKYDEKKGVVEVMLKFFGKERLMMVVNATTEEVLDEINCNWIKSWHLVRTSNEIRSKLTQTNESASIHQFLIDFHSIRSPLHLLLIDKSKMINFLDGKIGVHSDSTSPTQPHTSSNKRQYAAELLLPNETSSKKIILRFHMDLIHLRDTNSTSSSGDDFMKIPVIAVESIAAEKLKDEYIPYFEQPSENALIITLKASTPLILLPTEQEEIDEILNQWKKSSSQIHNYFQKLNNITVNCKLFNGLAITKRLTSSLKDDKLQTIAIDENGLYNSIDLDKVTSWILAIQSLTINHPIVLTSRVPTSDDEDKISNFISLLSKPNPSIPSLTSSNSSLPSSLASPSPLSSLSPHSSMKSTKDDSGSDIEINDYSLSE